MTNLTIVEKILRCLTPKFDHVVVAMEESGKIEKMTVAELQGSLEAQEQRLLERTTDKPVDQALQAQVQKKGGSQNKGNRGKNKNKENKGNSGKSSQDDHDHADSSSRKGGGSSFKGNGKKKLDRKNIRCFNCNKIAHFSNECKAPSSGDYRGKSNDEANFVKDGNTTDEDPVTLMMITHEGVSNPNLGIWYLDSGCSNHMTGHKEWLVNFDPSKRKKVRFADDRTILAEGSGDVLVKKGDGKDAVISDVLYVPGMKSNLISLGQLLEKGFTIQMNHGHLEVLDRNQRRVLRVPLTQNRTFQIKVNAVETECLATEVEDDSWLWHQRLGRSEERRVGKEC